MGAPNGQRNGHCWIPDEVVLTARDQYERRGLTAHAIARLIGQNEETVRAIIYYRRRKQPDAASVAAFAARPLCPCCDGTGATAHQLGVDRLCRQCHGTGRTAPAAV